MAFAVFGFNFTPPAFLSAEEFDHLRTTSSLVISKEVMADWLRLIVIEVLLWLFCGMAVVGYFLCTVSSASWVPIVGLLCALLAVALGFSALMTCVAFGVTYYFSNTYFTNRKHAARMAHDYAGFVHSFRPVHDKAVRFHVEGKFS